MAISKGSMFIFVGILLYCMGMIDITNATRFIHYDPLRGDVSPGCSPTHPELCKLHSANPYKRGCTSIDRCRGGSDIIDDAEMIVEGDAENKIKDSKTKILKSDTKNDLIGGAEKIVKGDAENNVKDSKEKILRSDMKNDLISGAEKIVKGDAGKINP
ncbi:uncharacterized protein LOC111025777 [Momordica charantia]|uniref:Uncharacterized protein LOC111025777 n=1 Tax=Momordica charantia TaxID=3673 RepID=A0A6J1DYH7_MOMCH|nr:uncharacterized protein LOC111025777 [Momordica charantia]